MSDIYQVLSELHIDFQTYTHPAVFTVEESDRYDLGGNAGKSKNLFIRNKKKNAYYLVVVESSKKVDLKKLGLSIGEKKLSFAAPEELKQYLNVLPGSVSPFGLIYDASKTVQCIIDTDLLTFDFVGFHPNINTATLVIKINDFKLFLEWTGNTVSFLNI